MNKKRVAIACVWLLLIVPSTFAQSLKLVPHQISLKNGKSFSLNLPEGFDIRVAAEGLKRLRFMAKSPDGRLFATDMYNLTDNSRGAVYIFEDFDSDAGRFRNVASYLTGLRNPNSIAFYTDKNGRDWFYLALTDRLVRYRYQAGERAPSGTPETLATFPDYGLSYKYGGWHLTRTIVFGGDKLYVAVGSSCNACVEKEDVRAAILVMDPDGKNRRFYARGLRNSVGLKWHDNQLFATNMGSDHLGNNRPDDTMYRVREGTNYGWPYCYEYRKKIYPDRKFPSGTKKCPSVPVAYTAFSAHSSPLGFEFFDANTADANLKNSVLVALHGSTNIKLRRGYRILRVRERGLPQDFINGFMQNGKINGRPCDIMKIGADAFLFTDDYAGVLYYVFKKS